VALVDQQTFPRDKVCGDGLIPDALGALDQMGLRGAIDAESMRLRELRVYVPNGTSLSLTGDFLCLPRIRLDQLIVGAASQAGAELIEGKTAVAPLIRDNRVSGATFSSPSGDTTIEAPFTLLATGANATVMTSFGLGAPLRPNAVAGRMYFQVSADVAARFRYLCIAYERSLCPGYGWIFPGPGHRFNVGVGFFSDGRRSIPSLRDLWQRFITTFEPAAAIVRDAEPLTEFRGAPMRTGLVGARFGRPGLLVIGEAAAMTYPATGEGIGKAMESGMLAARLVSEAVCSGRHESSVHEVYESEFRTRFRDRYKAYGIGQACTARPWLLNYLAWRANAGGFVRTELESLIAERGNPLRLLSMKGLATSLFQ
jgi:flavin-dependent dehydrogenase